MKRTTTCLPVLPFTIALVIAFVAGCSAEPGKIVVSGKSLGHPEIATTGNASLTMETRLQSGRFASITNGLTDALKDPMGIETDNEESLPDDLADPVLANRVTNSPYPDRTDPFEFGNGVDFDAPQAKQNEGQSLKLYGFVGSDSPKAIFHIDGKTKMLSAGEKWGVLEVLEVTPPTVRVKANGVARVWSLLGHHEQSEL